MSKYEKIMYWSLYAINTLALITAAIAEEYTKGLWILTATLWMYATHRYRRMQ